MTFLDIEEKKELLRIQIRLLTDHRTELEDAIRHDAAHLDIAVEMLATACACSKDDAARMVDDAYEVRQRARKVAVT